MNRPEERLMASTEMNPLPPHLQTPRTRNSLAQIKRFMERWRPDLNRTSTDYEIADVCCTVTVFKLHSAFSTECDRY
jgi:hypothetical protein